ncbi:MAG: divergent polysaccharide deacetylase family protein [Candidatus Aminicenantales bacterium]|jgi:polysaccharide deacetylase 2 family uncharacterized protein YibQ
MPGRAYLLLLAAALLTVFVVFVAVECPSRPDHPSIPAKDLGRIIEESVSRPGSGASSVHLFKAGGSEWHIQVVLSLEKYAALEARLEETIRAVPARVARKEQERRDGWIRFLWDVLGGSDDAPTRAILLFVCPENRPKAPSTPAGIEGASPSGGPVAAIIIDDVGYSMDIVRALGALGRPLTLAVLPGCPHTRESAQAALASGLEVMLHLPLESLDRGAARAPGTIDTNMPRAEIERRVAAFLDEIPGARGVNNHAGSKATEDPAVMISVLEVIKGRGLYFIDSRTSSRTVAYDAAKALGIPSASRRVFLDQPPGSGTVRSRLAELFRLARRDGAAVGIGHARPETVEALKEGLALADAEGVKLIFASQIVR